MEDTEIFVFGSNLEGRHKKGAALCALKEHGAILGQASGLQGQSYAIPTKSTPYFSLALVQINKYVADFIFYAASHPSYTFNVTPIGCGLAGYTPKAIAPMFYCAMQFSNINLPNEFKSILSDLKLHLMSN